MIPAKKDTQKIVDGIEKKIQNDENLAHMGQVIDVLFGTNEKRITKLLDEMFERIQQNKSTLRLVESMTILPEYRLARMISLLNPELSQSQEQSYCAVIRKGIF